MVRRLYFRLHSFYVSLRPFLQNFYMGITPTKYIIGQMNALGRRLKGNNDMPLNGWMAISPLIVFLVVYLTSSIIAKDFYRVPVSASFLVASLYAIIISRGRSFKEKFTVFSRGATNSNIRLMILIFILAGVFAATAEHIGAIDATVNLTLRLLPGNLIYAGLFIAACFISMSIGTSVGTIFALVPVGAKLASKLDPACLDSNLTAFITAIIVGGAFFGDNLSFISDTTIAATRTQGCSMKDKFKTNIRIVGPAALIVCGLYVFLGLSVEGAPEYEYADFLLILPYLLIIGLSLLGLDVSIVLAAGIAVTAIIGFSKGTLSLGGWIMSGIEGIKGMSDLIFVTLLAGGVLEIIRFNGGLDFITRGFTQNIRSKRGAELSIAGLVSISNICTANNTIAIITSGAIAKDITSRFGLNPRKVASILDTFSCLVQGFLPYGAQLLMAASLAGISSISIITYLYYPFIMGTCALLAILFRLPRKYS